MSPLDLDPTPTLLRRLRGELSASFDPNRPVRVARAPGRLDVMGGIADYTGSLVLEMPLAVAAAVALQPRDDGRVGVFSFNLLDDHRPFRFEVPVASLARPLGELRRDLAEPGRAWAGYLVGCLAVLHEAGEVDLGRMTGGLNLAVLSSVPVGGGVSSSAAVEVATMHALCGHLGVEFADPMRLPALCQRAENLVVGAPCGVMDQAASHAGHAGTLLRMRCQPHELLDPLPLPEGIRAFGVNTNVSHSVGGGAYGRTRAAAFLGHAMILDHMRTLAAESGRRMSGDPTGGYLANLDPGDYKAIFRPALPEAVLGRNVTIDHGDPATTIDADATYRVQAACDHHVLEAQRVRRFCDFVENLDAHGRDKALRSAGHLMYASHKSYGQNAGLGAAEADVIVDLVKAREGDGLYGAKITGGGSGGTVAVLLDDTDRAAAAVASLLREYESRTGRVPHLLDGTSPGAMHVGSAVVDPGVAEPPR